VQARLAAHWRLKLLLTVTLNLAFGAIYSLLGRWAVFPVRVPPQTWFDRVIPFQPEPWVWLYLSQFLFVTPLPWLIDTREGLCRYIRGLGFMCGVSFAVFLFFPVASPRPPDSATHASMQWLLRYDGAFNAFPSLHAAFLVYLAALGWRVFGRDLSRTAAVAAVLWAGLILYATIATRQHYAVDLLAGGIVGGVADWLAWRTPTGVSAAQAMARSRGVESHDG
jgi:membrane-associated phospholipid phosphatase